MWLGLWFFTTEMTRLVIQIITSMDFRSGQFLEVRLDEQGRHGQTEKDVWGRVQRLARGRAHGAAQHPSEFLSYPLNWNKKL